MPKEAPFDAWDGEELESDEDDGDTAAEEGAMHLEAEVDGDRRPPWSELTGETQAVPAGDGPVHYFADEQPDQPEASEGSRRRRSDQPVDLAELLERQHYAFKGK